MIKDFDAEPFIKKFEQSLQSLNKLKKLAQRKLDDIEDLKNASQKSFSQNIGMVNKMFSDTFETFNKLESRMTQVGNSAVIFGAQLEALDKQRIRAKESRDLVYYFIDINLGNFSKLDILRKSSGWEGKRKLAVIVKRLSFIAKDIDIPSTENARINISKYSDILRKDILEEFDQAYRDLDISVMANCAKVLYELDGEQSSCIQAYINQHEFFTSKLYLQEEINSLSAGMFLT